jgi:hypothetical protein
MARNIYVLVKKIVAVQPFLNLDMTSNFVCCTDLALGPFD